MGRKPQCPYCKSTKTHWKGYRDRRDGRARMRFCTNCKRKFTTKTVIHPARRRRK